eukprot:3386178-Amphidinium_carterae.1
MATLFAHRGNNAWSKDRNNDLTTSLQHERLHFCGRPLPHDLHTSRLQFTFAPLMTYRMEFASPTYGIPYFDCDHDRDV